MVDSVDSDQTLHYAASDLGLHCFLRPVCPKILGYYGTLPNSLIVLIKLDIIVDTQLLTVNDLHIVKLKTGIYRIEMN